MSARSFVPAGGRAFAVLSVVFALGGCSVLLDWSGYTGETADAADPQGLVDEAALAFEAGSPEVAPVDSGASKDVTSAWDVAETTGEAGDDSVADATPPDSGPPPCHAKCGGCCDPTGTCVGGRSDTTCGNAGTNCVDCTVIGQVCGAGACTAAPPPKDSGTPPPTCSQSACMAQTLCIPYYQLACCKVDQTCGCEVLFPPGPCR